MRLGFSDAGHLPTKVGSAQRANQHLWPLCCRKGCRSKRAHVRSERPRELGCRAGEKRSAYRSSNPHSARLSRLVVTARDRQLVGVLPSPSIGRVRQIGAQLLPTQSGPSHSPTAVIHKCQSERSPNPLTEHRGNMPSVRSYYSESYYAISYKVCNALDLLELGQPPSDGRLCALGDRSQARLRR